MAETFKLPKPGCYSGTVDGNPAVIMVDSDTVEAIWYVPKRGAVRGFAPQQNAWDSTKGRVRPIYRGNSVEVKIATRSRVEPPEGVTQHDDRR